MRRRHENRSAGAPIGRVIDQYEDVVALCGRHSRTDRRENRTAVDADQSSGAVATVIRTERSILDDRGSEFLMTGAGFDAWREQTPNIEVARVVVVDFAF